MITSKKILFGCISLMLLILYIMFTKQANDSYQSELIHKEFNIQEQAASIKIPVKAYDDATYVKIIKTLQQVSTKTGVNVIKQEAFQSYGQHDDGTVDHSTRLVKISYYATDLTNSTLDKIFDRKLKNGHYYSNKKELPKNNLGVEFEVSNLKNQHHTRKGYYFVDTQDTKKLNHVKQVLASEFSKNFNKSYTINDFESIKFPQGYKLIDILSYSFTISSLIVVIAIFIVIYVIIYSREITIYKLNGLTSLEIFNKIFLKDYAISIIAVTIIYYLVTRLLNWTLYKGTLIFMTKGLLLTFILIFIISLISIGLSSVSVLKGKEYTKYIFYGSYFVKGVLTVSLILSLIPLVKLVSSAENYVKNSFDSKQDYAVFYPTLIGYSYNILNDPDHETQRLIDEKLYDTFNDNGAIVFDDRDFHLPKEYQMQGNRFISLNNNYLKKEAVYDLDNDRINISEKEKQLIVLLPKSRAFMKNEINEYITKLMHKIEPQIILIKDDQKIKDFRNQTNDMYDYLVVTTLANSDYTNRFVMGGGATEDPLKIPYSGSAQQTYNKQYRKLFEKYNLDDNYPQLVSLNDLPQEELKDSLSGIGKQMTQLVITGILIIVFSFYTCHFYFTLRKKNIEVKLLMGKSFIKSITGLWLLLGVQYLVSIGYLMRENELNKHNIIALVLMLALEVMIEWLFMTRIARRKLWKQ